MSDLKVNSGVPAIRGETVGKSCINITCPVCGNLFHSMTLEQAETERDRLRELLATGEREWEAECDYVRAERGATIARGAWAGRGAIAALLTAFEWRTDYWLARERLRVAGERTEAAEGKLAAVETEASQSLDRNSPWGEFELAHRILAILHGESEVT